MAKAKIIQCKVCGADIASSAKTCPHCGARNKKKSPVSLIILVVVVLVILKAASGSSSSKANSNTSTSSNKTSTSSVSSVTTTSVPEATATPVPAKTSYGVGEPAESKGVTVTLVSVTESSGSTYNKPSDGNVFVLCEFEIENGSTNEITVSSMVSFTAYCDDYTCTYSLNALLEKGSKNQLDGSIAAGKKFNGVVGYEVPINWNELEIHFTPNFWSGKDIIFVAEH